MYIAFGQSKILGQFVEFMGNTFVKERNLLDEGEQVVISEPVVGRVPWSGKLFSAAVLQSNKE